MIFGAKWPGLSISVAAGIVSHSLEFTSNRAVKKWQFCGWKHLVDVRGQLRMGRLVPVDTKAIVNLIITLCNCGEQKSISES